MGEVRAEINKFWIAVRVRSKREEFVSMLLREKGYEEFLPTYYPRCEKRTFHSTRKVPLFPGYIFCRFDRNNTDSRIVTTPGVLQLVGVAGNPSLVPDEEIWALRKLIRSGIDCDPSQCAQVGELVRVIDGPLAGIIGVLIRIENRRRLLLSVRALNRGVVIVIDNDNIARVDCRHRCIPLKESPESAERQMR